MTLIYRGNMLEYIKYRALSARSSKLDYQTLGRSDSWNAKEDAWFYSLALNLHKLGLPDLRKTANREIKIHQASDKQKLLEKLLSRKFFGEVQVHPIDHYNTLRHQSKVTSFGYKPENLSYIATVQRGQRRKEYLIVETTIGTTTIFQVFNPNHLKVHGNKEVLNLQLSAIFERVYMDRINYLSGPEDIIFTQETGTAVHGISLKQHFSLININYICNNVERKFVQESEVTLPATPDLGLPAITFYENSMYIQPLFKENMPAVEMLSFFHELAHQEQLQGLYRLEGEINAWDVARQFYDDLLANGFFTQNQLTPKEISMHITDGLQAYLNIFTELAKIAVRENDWRGFDSYTGNGSTKENDEKKPLPTQALKGAFTKMLTKFRKALST